MGSSNQFNQGRKFLANKPRNEVDAKEEIFRIDEGKNSAGNTTFATNYGRWLEKHNRLICEIRSSLNEEVVDDKLVFLIDIVMKHYVEFSEMKTSAANFDVSNVAWNTTAEHSVWWIGGFRPSQLLQVIVPQLQHSCSQQQLSDIWNFVQSCKQVEYALARGMEKLHQILHNATTEGDKGLKLTCASQHMRFLKQANDVRQEFLHQLCGLLTNSQYAEFLLGLGERLHNPASSL
ncbi:transcription factor TGA4-like [Vigna unguiculata]|uniref:Transcription factor TGA n=1 Tax=Vigna unguiculata TaxID=3917 RepID=A0A4D6N4E4_VIGUN|nr:transcription factor TGA4-like [Vigna unguiculata]QCE07772.1 transcription factor TGA [Vigna unguiculata]